MDKVSTALGLATAGAVTAVFGGVSAALASYAARGERYTLQQTWDTKMKEMPFLLDYRPIQDRPRGDKEYTVRCKDGYVLHAQVWINHPESRKYVILVHGYTINRYCMLGYLPIWDELGYNCIVYDQRGHGENVHGPVCTFGAQESEDLLCVINDAYARFGHIYLALHGESLGSGTIVTALKYHPPVKMAVLDCGFADIQNVMQKGLKGLHVPPFMFYPASTAAKIMYGHAYIDERPIDSLPGNTVPLCYMHGDGDTFIPPENSVRMNSASRHCYHELHLFAGSEHAMSRTDHPEEYAKLTKRFVRRIERRDGIA